MNGWPPQPRLCVRAGPPRPRSKNVSGLKQRMWLRLGPRAVEAEARLTPEERAYAVVPEAVPPRLKLNLGSSSLRL